MDQNQDFSALRNLLALKRLETPLNTEVDRFLIELHRRQRAQLLVPESAWVRALAWIKERTAGLALFPSLSYVAATAAIVLTAFVGLSPQVQVTQTHGGYKLSLHMPSNEPAFAMLPTTLAPPALTSSNRSDLSFAPNHSTATTRFVLAQPRLAYDANAF